MLLLGGSVEKRLKYYISEGYKAIDIARND